MFNSTIAIRLVGALLGVAGVAGCSSQDAANEKNFSKAIEVYLSGDPECVFLSNLGSLPGEKSAEPRGLFARPSGAKSEPRPVSVDEFLSRNRLEAALASAGLIGVKITQREAEPYLGAGRTVLQSFAEINLTDKGAPYYRSVSAPLLGKRAAICFAQKELVAIQNFTDPAEAMGHKISRVAYTWQLTNIADWARDDAIVAADARLKATLNKVNAPQSEQAVLILTNNGWVHEKIFGVQTN